jgi:hypothetical protein
MRRAVLASLAVAAVAATALPSHAATTTFKDAKGDALGAQAAYDITAVSFSTTGTGKGRAYKPTSMVVSMTLAAAPANQAGTAYEVSWTMESCGTVTITHSPTTALGGYHTMWLPCAGADGEGYDVAPKTSGSTLTWKIPLKALPKGFGAGTTLTALEAMTQVVEPATGIIGTGEFVSASAIDVASTDAEYVIS